MPGSKTQPDVIVIGELRDLIESNERLTARLECLLAKMEPLAPQDPAGVPETRSEKSAAAD